MGTTTCREGVANVGMGCGYHEIMDGNGWVTRSRNREAHGHVGIAVRRWDAAEGTDQKVPGSKSMVGVISEQSHCSGGEESTVVRCSESQRRRTIAGAGRRSSSSRGMHREEGRGLGSF